jgi:dihydrofolate reductase
MAREFVLIAAVARNGVIGRNNALPWRLKGDMRFFRETTTGHTVVMGRKTWDSLGRPLPNRRNVVVTRNPSFKAEGAAVVGSLEAAFATAADGPIFLIGGAELYHQALPYADRLLITEVDAEVEGDACFPDFDRSAFVETARTSHPADAGNDYPYDLVEYRRR